MNRQIITTLFFNTFQKEIRNKTLIFIFILSIAVILLMNVLFNFVTALVPSDGMQTDNAILLTGQKLKIFYWIISIWGGILGTFLGVNTIKSDMTYGISSQIVAFPIHPMSYILTRIIGTWVIVNLYYVVTFVMALIIFHFSAGGSTFSVNIIYSFFIYTFVILVFITLGALLSIFFQKTVSLITALILNFLIITANSYFSGVGQGEVKSFFSAIGLGLHYLFPRIGLINDFSGKIFYSGNFDFKYLSEIPHFLISYFFMIYILYFIFKKKDFQV